MVKTKEKIIKKPKTWVESTLKLFEEILRELKKQTRAMEKWE